MKKYIVILLVFISTSCNEFLDIVPDNLATIELAFNTRASAEKFLATCYSYVPEHAHVEQNFSLVAGDEIWYYAERDFYMNNETSLRLAKGMQNTTDPYCNYWEGRRGAYNMFVSIRDCNIFLDNLKDIPGLEMDEKNRWIAEVKTLKAFYHFWMLRLYGPIPIIDQNISVDAGTEEIYVERQPVDEVVDYIVELLDEAINSEDLPESIKFIYTEYGRLTLPAAKAIKAKVLMLAASPLFNGNDEYSNFVSDGGEQLVNPVYDPEKWVRAKDACLDAILAAETAGHDLYSFTDLLPIGEISDVVRHELTLRATITDKFNKELIWGIGPNWTGDLQAWCQPRWTGDHAADFGQTKKSHAPTLNVVEDFYTVNGVPINEDKNWAYADRYDLVNVKDQIGDDHKYYLQNNYTTINNTQIINTTFTDAPNISFPKKIKGHLDEYIKRGPLGGLSDFIVEHFCKDIPPEQRTIWCTDHARNKYLLREDDKWSIDIGGNKFMKITQPEIYKIFKKYMQDNLINSSDFEDLQNKGEEIDKMIRNSEFLNHLAMDEKFMKALKDAASKEMIYQGEIIL